MTNPLGPIILRFMKNVEVRDDGCWHWLGRVHDTGYGRFFLDGRAIHAHRASYSLFVSPVPPKIHVHHRAICGNKLCVRPDHLELLSASDHLKHHLAWDSPEAKAERHARATATRLARPACRKGHEWTPENTIIEKDGSRVCKACRRASQLKYAEAHPKDKGPTASEKHRAKTTCPQGHEYSGDNLYLTSRGGRACRACAQLRNRANKQRLREEQKE